MTDIELRHWHRRKLQAERRQKDWRDGRYGYRYARNACTATIVRRMHAMGARTL